MDVSGETVLAMSYFRAAKSIFDKQRIGATSGLVAGLGMFKWHGAIHRGEGFRPARETQGPEDVHFVWVGTRDIRILQSFEVC